MHAYAYAHVRVTAFPLCTRLTPSPSRSVGACGVPAAGRDRRYRAVELPLPQCLQPGVCGALQVLDPNPCLFALTLILVLILVLILTLTLTQTHHSGNAIVIKVSEYASWSIGYYKRIIDACLEAVGAPKDLVQFVVGYGPTGDALVRSGVDKVSDEWG